MRSSLALTTRASTRQFVFFSSHPIVLVECRVFGEPYAATSAQLLRNVRTSAAILIVEGVHTKPASGYQTHVVLYTSVGMSQDRGEVARMLSREARESS
jgi:hypothetical protein